MDRVQMDSLDVLKAVLATMVVAIHARLFPSVLDPWIRIAVPCFFMMSSYFFFVKHKSVKGFVARLGRLYIGWFIVLLPITLYSRRHDWFDGGCVSGVVEFTKSLLFGNTFPASCFFSALILAVIIVNLLTRKIPVHLVVLLSLFPFAHACICSSYPAALEGIPLLCVWHKFYRLIANPVYSVSSAILWVALGALLAQRRMRIGRSAMVASFIVGCCLLYCEWRYVVGHGGGISNDCYFSLPFVVVPLFLLLKDIDLRCAIAHDLREFSVVAYPLHYAVIICSAHVLNFWGIGDDSGLVRFMIGLMAVVCIMWGIRKAAAHGITAVNWLR